MSYLLEDLKSFLDSSPTSWHCVRQVGNRLAIRDFSPLSEDKKWELEQGKKYFTSRGGSLCAFCLPKQAPQKIVILAAHTDSPALKLKPKPEVVKEEMTLMSVEVYGGPLLHSWLNRDLALAGRFFFTDKKGTVREELVWMDDIPLMIPQLAIHLDREVNEKGLVLNKQDHLLPLLSLSQPEESHIESLLRRYFSFHHLLSFDLFLVPLEPARFMGMSGEMLASSRLDNLISVHAAASALASYKDSSILPMAIFWDHEEIGSKTWEGAYSSFLNDVLQRLRHFYKMDDEEFLILKRNSFCFSLDMAHAFNPNYPQKYDPNHQPLLGKGIVIKSNADLKYASSGYSISHAVQVCKRANLHYQHFACRSDMPCGSTVGPIISQITGIPTLDMGCAQLSMHSSRELIATQDYLDLNIFLSEALKEE
jgi:aspartyl aminopeptidase